jgi:hypothetical protein
MSKLSDIDIIGIDSGNAPNTNPQENIILRIEKKNPIADLFPYLIVADNVRSLDGKTDLLVFDPFQGKDALKIKAKRGLGIEILVSPVRKLDAHLSARWLRELKSIYLLCQSNDCQFILSSGATSTNEMISARSFESILAVAGIDPRIYWRKLSEWLYSKTKARWRYVKS